MALENLFGELATDEKLELVRLLINSIDGKLNLNDDGRIKVASMPANYDLQYADITAIGQTFAFPVDNISNIVLQAVAYPTVAGHTAYFEASLNSTDGVDGNWFGIQAARTNANTVELFTGSTSLAVTPSYGWELSVNAYKWVRVRCSAHTSGTMRWYAQAGSYATEPIPISQSTTASIGSIVNTLYSDSTTNLAPSAVYTGSSRDSGSTNTHSRFVARSFSDQAGNLLVQDSTDGTTWRNVKSVATSQNVMADLDVEIVSRYHRVLYTNGSTATTVLRITSALKKI